MLSCMQYNFAACARNLALPQTCKSDSVRHNRRQGQILVRIFNASKSAKNYSANRFRGNSLKENATDASQNNYFHPCCKYLSCRSTRSKCHSVNSCEVLGIMPATSQAPFSMTYSVGHTLNRDGRSKSLGGRSDFLQP